MQINSNLHVAAVPEENGLIDWAVSLVFFSFRYRLTILYFKRMLRFADTLKASQQEDAAS